MIPPFNNSGYLPPGVHAATLNDIALRFGTPSELRRVQMESVRWFVDLAVRAGAQRIILNGSFVTDTIEPNDVDCVLLFKPGGRGDKAAIKEIRDGLPFLSVAIVGQKGFDNLVNRFFATDRRGADKGLVEVIV